MVDILIQKLSSDGFWSISSALIGAFTGALFGFLTSIYLELSRESKVKNAFYNEVAFLSGFMSSYLASVVSEYEKSKIDPVKNDSFSGPRDLDFSVLNTLFLELYKTKSIPSDDYRRFVHNVSTQWERVYALDIGRVTKAEGSSVYHVSPVKCKEIVYFLVDLLYHFNVFVEQREKFSFQHTDDFTKMALLVFEKYKIDNPELVEQIANDTYHW